MKTVQQIVERIDLQIESLRFGLEDSAEETALKRKREGALAALEELRRFIVNERWKP